MKIKLFTGVIQGIRVLEKQVSGFCMEHDIANIQTTMAGAQVIMTVCYHDKPAMMSETAPKVEPKAKRSKAKSK